MPRTFFDLNLSTLTCPRTILASLAIPSGFGVWEGVIFYQGERDIEIPATCMFLNDNQESLMDCDITYGILKVSWLLYSQVPNKRGGPIIRGVGKTSEI